MKKTLLLLIALFLLCITDCYSQSLNWELKAAPYSRHISAGHILANGEFFIFGGNPSNDSIQLISFSKDSGANWNIVIDAPSNPKINDATFVNQSVAFAIGDAGSVQKSTDGGKNWTSILVVANLRTRQFQGIHCITPDTAYMVGGNLTNDSISTIIRTVNGGLNWQKRMDNIGPRLNDVHFYKNNLGIAVGDRGTVFMTEDGGVNWSPKTIPGNAGSRTFSAARYINETTLIIVGGNKANDSIQTMIKSTDAGNTWSVIKDTKSPMLNDIDFLPDGKTGIAVGDHGLAYSTSDTGNTWTVINLPMNTKLTLNSINYVDAKNAIIGGQHGAVYVAHDATTLSINELQLQQLTICANPIFNHAQITDIHLYSNFQLISLTGQTISLNKAEPNTLDFTDVSSGIYFLSFTNKSGNTFYQKIQKL